MKKVFNKVLKRWGVNVYHLCAAEELAELSKVILKIGRRRQFDLSPTKEQISDLVDELADVSIMCDLLKHYYKIYGKVDKRIVYKLRRMESRLKDKTRKYF